MNEEAAFLRAVAANPGDEAGWLIYADWLDERGSPKGEYLRLSVALSAGEIPDERLEAVTGQLARLSPQIEPSWREGVARLRAGRPLRIWITDVWRTGNVPPREMFDRAMTFVNGYLLSGTVRFGEAIAIPLQNGGVAIERALHLHTLTTSYEELTAGLEPATGFAMMWPGHRLADLGVRKHGTIVRAGGA